MANETTIKIKATPDGKDCTFEIVEEEAKTGTRVDQVAAQGVLNMDQMLRDQNFRRAYQQMQNQNSMPPHMRRGGFNPMGGGGMFPGNGGMFSY
jgi:hypothetical protein